MTVKSIESSLACRCVRQGGLDAVEDHTQTCISGDPIDSSSHLTVQQERLGHFAQIHVPHVLCIQWYFTSCGPLCDVALYEDASSFARACLAPALTRRKSMLISTLEDVSTMKLEVGLLPDLASAGSSSGLT